MAYEIDGGTMLGLPGKGKQPYYKLNAGKEYCIIINIGSRFNQEDKVQIVNLDFWEEAIFEYSYKPQ